MKENGTLWGRTVRTTRRLTAVGAIAFAVLVWTGTAMAVTTVDTVIAASQIYSDGSCDTGLGLSPNHQFSYSHANGDSVDIPMAEAWDDDRTDGSDEFNNTFRIEARYQGVPSSAEHVHVTDGADHGTDTLQLTVPNVQTGTSMDVTYIAYVRLRASPYTILCYEDLPVTYNFTA